ncbi:MAG: MotA/TolQ/ExbB proton channel family protein [Verrucomicrobiales bacterium]|nr:MotA/TolQ/ExbB proton channel family protein [Verrucomicrobiales bacterium]
MVLSVIFPPLLASLRAAIDQPIFPGKVIVWLLFMLSIIGWVTILSKLVQLRRMRHADQAFTDRLRQSKTTLEVFEEGWEDELALKSLIYQAGARETAYQLLGSREPQDRMQQRLRQAGKLVGRQIDFLRMAFQTGFRAAAGRLQNGIESLRLIAAAAMLLGTFGLVWTLMKGFDEAKEFSELAPRIGAGLGYFTIALFVAAPATIARIAIRNLVRKRKQELERFRDDIHRLFERSFAAALDPVRPTSSERRPSAEVGSERPRREAVDPAVADASVGDRPAGPAPKPAPRREPEPVAAYAPEVETDSGDGEERKRYHSIRDRLLRSEADEEASSPFRVNPIARQAAAASGKGLRGY